MSVTPKAHVIDVVDMYPNEDGGGCPGLYWKDCLQGHNTTTIAIGGTSNAIEMMVDMVVSAVGGQPRTVRCLALWGHGLVDADHNPLGIHLLAGGWRAKDNRSAFTNDTVLTLSRVLARLGSYFAPDARVELRGCGVAGTAEGLTVMKMLASLWTVRVQAAKRNQPTMSWLPPVVEVSPGGAVTTVNGVEYTART